MGCTGEDPGICPTGTTGQAYTLPIELSAATRTRAARCTPSSGRSLAARAEHRLRRRPTSRDSDTGGHVRLLPHGYVQPADDLPVQEAPSDDRFGSRSTQGLAKLTIGPESTTSGTVGTPYSLQMTATVADPKTWSINSGALPPGLAIDAATGLISGTPTAAGQFDFQVLAKMNADTRSDTKVLAIVVRDQLGVLGADPFTAARRATGEVSVPFDALLTATGGDGTYTWSLSSGELPPGLEIADGTISGTPTTAGVYPFTATVTDAEGRVANYPARILIAEKLAISTTLFRPAKQGFYYQAKLKTAGGVLPRTWRIVRGPLPRGIRFDRSAGLLFGIPTRPGRFRVTFEATDALGVTAKKTLAILVVATPKPKPKKPTTG